ncbi:GNAT family N-acetyltransferase [Solitalea sp. MAHUQ-68]|uniref:GNAT family N-acetyltransferase n=1 Tax=Solitalea agri TaxID=2953739 RepID=A0A9X2F2Z5_9SPHI|nr:GNAT family N-acetyltransferase [Solitalea agri]MCO4293774.1 GNAT family N-acetyltransferase [Solitalea agri]
MATNLPALTYNDLTFQELTISNWFQFEKLMGDKGGCGGCWCMAFRLSTKEFNEQKYEGNKSSMYSLVEEGRPIGIIAFCEDEPIGWIALAPREDYLKIEKSRSLKPIDDKPVWSITCFFIGKEFRRVGLSKLLIKGAVDFARYKGIKTLEAYPAIPYDNKVPAAFLWVGILSAFLLNGFEVVKQNGKSRAIVRLDV